MWFGSVSFFCTFTCTAICNLSSSLIVITQSSRIGQQYCDNSSSNKVMNNNLALLINKQRVLNCICVQSPDKHFFLVNQHTVSV